MAARCACKRARCFPLFLSPVSKAAVLPDPQTVLLIKERMAAVLGSVPLFLAGSVPNAAELKTRFVYFAWFITSVASIIDEALLSI